MNARRSTIVLLVIVLLAGMLPGCQSAPSQPTAVSPPAPAEPTNVPPTATAMPEPVVIEYWDYRGGALVEFIKKEMVIFHEQYPWITINLTEFPDRRTYQEAVSLAFESGNAPDVFVRPVQLASMIKSGWIQPLDPHITPEWLNKFPAGSFLETVNMWQGKIYSYPANMSGVGRMLFLNTDMFKAAGLVDSSGAITPPKTWSDFRTMAKKITEAGKGKYYGIALSTKEARSMMWWFDMASLAGCGMAPYDYDFHTGKYEYGTNPAYAQIVELLLGMKADGSVYPYESTIEDANIHTFFGQEQFAIMMTGSYAVSNLAKDFPDFQNYEVVPLPVPDGGQTGQYALGPSGVYYLSSETKNPQDAWLWMDWLSHRDVHQRMVQQTTNYSIYSDLNNAQNITDPHAYQAYLASAAFGALAPFPPARNPNAALVQPEPVTPDFSDLLIGIYTGQVSDWKQALLDLDARKQAALEAAIAKAQADGLDVSMEDFIFADWDPMESYLNYPDK
jgi:multiple sugar transport system substrate-binding protein